jgi:hypothetical protein
LKLGAPQQYYVYLYVENKYSKDIRLHTSLTNPEHRNTTIGALRTKTLRFPTTSQVAVKVTAFDSTTGQQIKINNNDFVVVVPSVQTATATALSVTSRCKILLILQNPYRKTPIFFLFCVITGFFWDIFLF